MPEAAEVTVAAGQLARVAIGRTLEALPVTHVRTMRATTRAALDTVVGHRVTGVDPVGKWLLVSFDGLRPQLGIHLRMSGQLLATEPDQPHPDRHVHAVLELSPRPTTPEPRSGRHLARLERANAYQNGVWVVPEPPPGAVGIGPEPCAVWFRDPRTFGEVRILTEVPTAEDVRADHITADLLQARASTRRVGVKPVMLDQARFVAGIGSYVADEALWAAGIDPRRPANTLAVTAWDRILTSTRQIIAESAAVGGVTLPDDGWIDLWGRPGTYGVKLAIHGRDICTRCQSPTQRAVIAGRSARWCPACQPRQRRR